MINVIEDEKINWFVNHIFPSKALLELNPVIAGGSMLSLYRALRLHDSDEKWNAMVRTLTKNPKTAKVDSFGDIDIWFHSSEDIHSTGSKYHWLIGDGSLQTSFRTKEFPGTPLGLDGFCKASGWANSFRSIKKLPSIYNGEVQFVKTPISSVEDLLSSFDFINCSVAFYNGRLFYDSRIDNAFSNFELQINSKEPFEKDSIAMNVFGALRAFKYSDRYCIDFGASLSEYIFNLYVKTKNVDYEKYGDKIIELETLYGKKISSVDTLKGMVTHFHFLFEKFSKMKYFKKEYPLYLVDQADKFGGLKKLIGAEIAPKHSSFKSSFAISF
jgi:hypothetical protein